MIDLDQVAYCLQGRTNLGLDKGSAKHNQPTKMVDNLEIQGIPLHSQPVETVNLTQVIVSFKSYESRLW